MNIHIEPFLIAVIHAWLQDLVKHLQRADFELKMEFFDKKPKKILTIGDTRFPYFIKREVIDSGHVLISAQFFIIGCEITRRQAESACKKGKSRKYDFHFGDFFRFLRTIWTFDEQFSFIYTLRNSKTYKILYNFFIFSYKTEFKFTNQGH